MFEVYYNRILKNLEGAFSNVCIKGFVIMFLILDIKVVPNSSSYKIIQDKLGIIKCYVHSAPENGKANKELIKLWSERLGVSKSSIEIISGLTNARKKLRVNTLLTKAEIMNKLGFEVQQDIKIL